MHRSLAVLVCTLVLLAAGGLGLLARDSEHESEVGLAAATGPRTVIWALGDGADGSAASRRLAAYVRAQRPDRFLYLGDVYEYGTPGEFARDYAPLYGALARRTDPVIGNHEYPLRTLGYGAYWRHARGWSATKALHRAYVDRTGWQILAYNSEGDTASEARWVGRQVAAHPGTCRIALAHRALHMVADDLHGDQNADQAPIWARLAHRTALLLTGHNHLYGRLAPIQGMTVVVSGAGGHRLRRPGTQSHPVRAIEVGVPTATQIVLQPGVATLRQVDATGRVYDRATFRCTPVR